MKLKNVKKQQSAFTINRMCKKNKNKLEIFVKNKIFQKYYKKMNFKLQNNRFVDFAYNLL